MTGVVNKVKAWLNSKPPTIATPKGLRNSAPLPALSINGKALNNAAKVVIKIGLNRNKQAW